MNRVTRRPVAAPTFVVPTATSTVSTCHASARVNPLVSRSAVASQTMSATPSCNGDAFAADPAGEAKSPSPTLSAQLDAVERRLVASATPCLASPWRDSDVAAGWCLAVLGSPTGEES